MEDNFILHRNMIILDGRKIEEFIEKSKNGSVKRVIEKYKRLEEKRNKNKLSE